jgi:hypothetical protein
MTRQSRRHTNERIRAIGNFLGYGPSPRSSGIDWGELGGLGRKPMDSAADPCHRIGYYTSLSYFLSFYFASCLNFVHLDRAFWYLGLGLSRTGCLLHWVAGGTVWVGQTARRGAIMRGNWTCHGRHSHTLGIKEILHGLGAGVCCLWDLTMSFCLYQCVPHIFHGWASIENFIYTPGTIAFPFGAVFEGAHYVLYERVQERTFAGPISAW